MSGEKQLRKRLYVDPKLQGTLIARVVLYWFVCLLGITLMLLCWRIASGPPRPFIAIMGELWSHYWAALAASVLLLPMVIVDVVRYSNRFVGPVLRLRRSMRRLARGERVEPMEFRGDDFWREFADEFNAVARCVENHPEEIAERFSHQPEEEEPVAVG